MPFLFSALATSMPSWKNALDLIPPPGHTTIAVVVFSVTSGKKTCRVGMEMLLNFYSLGEIPLIFFSSPL
ncbi:MAG: hypothetical protein O2806_07360 [Bacteroidetes bacterium]|nr:hypothetical protein [Bacteroidota bacterium]